MPQAKAKTRNSQAQKSRSKSSNSNRAKSSGSAAAQRSGSSRARPSARSSNGRGATRPANRPNRPASKARRPSGSAAKPTRTAAKATAEKATTAGKATKSAGARVVDVAQKARTPLVAGGVTAVGVAGAAVALALRSSRDRKILGVPVSRRGLKLPVNGGNAKRDARKLAATVSDVAKRADRFGQSVSKVAGTVQQVSETAEGAAKKV